MCAVHPHQRLPFVKIMIGTENVRNVHVALEPLIVVVIIMVVGVMNDVVVQKTWLVTEEVQRHVVHRHQKSFIVKVSMGLVFVPVMVVVHHHQRPIVLRIIQMAVAGKLVVVQGQ